MTIKVPAKATIIEIIKRKNKCIPTPIAIFNYEPSVINQANLCGRK